MANSYSMLVRGAGSDTSTLQPLDPELSALAGLTSAADKVPYFTGDGTAALATLSSFGRTLIATADAAAARTALALGTAATAATGTSGATIPLLNVAATWAAKQVNSAVWSSNAGFEFCTSGSTNINVQVGGFGLIQCNDQDVIWNTQAKGAGTNVFGGGSNDTRVGWAAQKVVKLHDGAGGGNALAFPEMTAPAGAADQARLYAVDNGSGKTKLMVIFGTGAAVQLAIEP